MYIIVFSWIAVDSVDRARPQVSRAERFYRCTACILHCNINQSAHGCLPTHGLQQCTFYSKSAIPEFLVVESCVLTETNNVHLDDSISRRHIVLCLLDHDERNGLHGNFNGHCEQQWGRRDRVFREHYHQYSAQHRPHCQAHHQEKQEN